MNMDGEFPEDDFPGGDALLGEEIIDAVAAEGGEEGCFAPIKKHFEETGHKAFDDPAYYKTALGGGGDLVQRLHTVFQKLLQTKDPKDRTQFRMQIVPVFWEYMGVLARQTILSMPDPKRFLLRFALLHPGVLSANHRQLFSTIIRENYTNEPVYYLDEWFAGIGRGEIHPSATDEVRVSRGNTDAHLKELYERACGKLDASKGMVLLKHKGRLDAEAVLKNQIVALTTHTPSPVFADVSDRYSEAQRKMFTEIQDSMRVMIRIDREIEALLRDIENALSDIDTLSGKIELSGKAATAIDTGAIDGEFQTIRQMVKMSIGRRGNTFPILSGEYFHCLPNGIGTRENVISVLSWIESIDEEAYIRVHRKQVERIVPYVILLPTYGDFGFCWEPFERLNKATSRGRIAIPLYPKNLTVAILLAVADLRWQAAKEKASYYWMEEGLTGNYYQWFAKQKLRGDIKGYFMQDYLLWMTKESEGIQKLDKELRGIFWHYMPFTRQVKERLKDRNLVYQELYQRDLNRAMSDL
ncbi:MAG: hypothetical protein LBT00_13240 [Spirochaetaceae bacterium]|jgi:hypothetical protein|nr:hypothetical protein [Spirochaetaceae bacterium]